MKVFELIKTVLDEEYGLVKKKDRNTIIKNEIKKLGDAYNDLIDPKVKPPNYSTAPSRFAYIYKYTTCHANIVAEKISAVKELRDLFDTSAWVDVAAVGGGPGSDFLGVVKHLISQNSKASLKCYLLDAEPGWGDTWSDVDRRTDEFDFRVSTHSQRLDVTDPATWEEQNRYLKANLFTFVYFISEVYRMKERAQPFFEHLFAKAKSGSFLLFIDNDVSEFYEWFDNMASAAGLDRAAGREERFQLDWAEEKKLLEPYNSTFSHHPKIRTFISWRVYRKP